jgi:DNA-binding LytR/AlgR family response regulator
MTLRLRVVIVDDEPLSRLALRQLLRAVPDLEIVAECRDAVEAEEWLREVDVVFLDVQMPGCNGLSAAHAWESLPWRPSIVFVTAFDQYALPAFETEAVDYLTKPVRRSRLAKAIKRVRERAELAAADIRAARPLVTRIGDRDLVIPIDSIERIEAEGVYAAVWQAGRRLLVRMSLETLEVRLATYGFTRVHRSWLVPMNRVQSIKRTRKGGTAITLDNGRVVPVSRRRYREVKAAFRGDRLPAGNGRTERP